MTNINLNKKIVLVIYSLEKGGAEKIFSFLANNLDLNSFQITVITIKEEDPHSYSLRPEVNYVSLGFNRTLFSFYSLYKEIMTISPDIILSTLIPVNIVLGLFKRLGFFPNTKFVMRESSIPSINNKNASGKSFMYNFLLKNLYNYFDKIIVQSTDMREDLINIYKVDYNKIFLINNPLFFSSNTSRLSEILNNINTDEVILLSVGNLRPEKGHIRLIRTLSGLRSRLNFRLWIVGDGVMRSQIESEIHKTDLYDNVLLFGFQDNVMPFLAKANLLLQTSYYEGFPNVLLESMGVGLPVIAYNVLGGTKEIIINGFNGYLVDDNNESAFQDAILNALEHPFDKQQIIEDVYSRFSQKTILNHYQTALKFS